MESDHDQDRNELDPFWNNEDSWEEDLPTPPWKKRVIKIGALLALIVFISFSYAWLPLLWPPHLDFLQQNAILSQDDLVKQTRPSVVRIKAIKSAGAPALGTGFNTDPSGVIVTNRHVVEGASSVEVTFADQSSYISQDIILVEDMDGALIKLGADQLPYLDWEDNLPEKQQTVTIIGNPRGVSQVAVRGPILSFYDNQSAAPLVFSIDALVEPGSSGSPVLNDAGRVVGMIYAYQSSDNSSVSKKALAIPSVCLLPFIEEQE